MKKLKDKLIEMVIERVIEYLEMPEEEQSTKRQFYEEKLRSLKAGDAMKRTIKRVSIGMSGIILIMLYAVAISEPMRNLIMSVFSKTKTVSEAFYDFTPKLLAASIVFITAYATVALMMKLYSLKKGAEAVEKALKVSLISAQVIIAVMALSTLCYTFATGSIAPLVQQIAPLLTRPPIGWIFIMALAAYLATVGISAYALLVYIKTAICSHKPRT